MAALSDWTSAPAPELEADQLLALLETHWGLSGELERLYAERDLNHRLTTPDGRQWLVKLSHPDATFERLAFEHRVLRRLAADRGAPRVPGILEARDGGSLQPVPGVGHLRVLEWLEGVPLGDCAPDTARRTALGQCCARLNKALAGLLAAAAEPETKPDPDSGLLPRNLPWDLMGVARLAPLAEHLPDPGARSLAVAVLDRFDRDTDRRLRCLPRQLIHNDLNPDNLLVDTQAPAALPAVIDFGDMVRAPVVCDLAIACAYHVEVGADPLRRVRDVILGFHSERPLAREEQDLLPALIAGRLAQTLLIQGARFADGGLAQEDTYRTAFRWLGALMAADGDAQESALRDLCDTAGPGS